MKTVAVTINIDMRELATAIASELGPVDLHDRRPPAAPAPVRIPTYVTRILTVESAIDNVLKATTRLEDEQYSRGEHGATIALFEAAKKLRSAVYETQRSRKKS